MARSRTDGDLSIKSRGQAVCIHTHFPLPDIEPSPVISTTGTASESSSCLMRVRVFFVGGVGLNMMMCRREETEAKKRGRGWVSLIGCPLKGVEDGSRGRDEKEVKSGRELNSSKYFE